MSPLYVIKIGSATLEHESVFGELAELVARGARVLVVAGGAAGIERHYRETGRRVPTLSLANGERVRHCPPEEVPHLVDAYEQVTLPLVTAGLEHHGLTSFVSVAGRSGLAGADTNRPVRALTPTGRTRVVRDHRVGVPNRVDTARITTLLEAFDVVCLSPPVADNAGGGMLNADADVLAAVLSNALGADHLRLVTGTRGLLRDADDPASTVHDLHPGEGDAFAHGRMRQKVRAAEMALDEGADVAVTGPHTMADPTAWSRFWRLPEPGDDLRLLTRAASIPSVSGDEHELAVYLRTWCHGRGIDAHIDGAGNLVAERGRGERALMLLGHMDTVPHHWPVHWQGEELSGRGTVDAKGSLACFLEVLASARVPEGTRLTVVGAVEEEISTSRGAFHVRDHQRADAVVIGEPSGSRTLTLGYFGLFKLGVTVTVPAGHSAGADALSAPDKLISTLSELREAVLAQAPDALSAIIDVGNSSGLASHSARGVLNFRVPPGADIETLLKTVVDHTPDGVDVQVLRSTPGRSGGRTSPPAKAFGRSFAHLGIRPRHVVKKGTSDMNTLATTWDGVPMVAFGPGDSSLDHTDTERIGADEYRRAREVLSLAVANWLGRAAEEER
ncbi:M20/M25/M40 family metallo-hydrolase [Nocardiopsis kunsanensis]|uniref:M20/M25/M40 family metallo-hydrolase n=1 Tax=Nocardiopsis kunsanensis TaxID=141693 RepID=UPI00034DE469|nr:M20/M25/M40 family metallo-hydrolase [Nocardiopsis kunsanensis]